MNITDHHIHYLNLHGCPNDRYLLERTLGVQLRSATSESPQFPGGPLRALELDLSYALIKHRYWIQAPLFVEFLILFLQTEYAFTRDRASSLVSKLIEDFGNQQTLLNGLIVNTTDNRELVRYLLCLILKSPSKSEPVWEIGLGDKVLALLKQAVNEATSPQGQWRHQSKLDRLVFSIIKEFSEISTESPAALDLSAFTYQIIHPSQEIVQELRNGGTADLFSVLVRVAHEGTIRHPDLVKTIKNATKTWPPIPSIENAVLNTLQTCDLIFPIATHSNGHTKLWQISDLGLEITAPTCFQILTKSTIKDEAEILQLPPVLQSVALQEMARDNVEKLLSFVRNWHQELNPRTLEQVGTLIMNRAPKQAREMLHQIITKDSDPRRQLAACRCLAEHELDDNARELFKNISLTAESINLKRFAFLSLIKYGFNTPSST